MLARLATTLAAGRRHARRRISLFNDRDGVRTVSARPPETAWEDRDRKDTPPRALGSGPASADPDRAGPGPCELERLHGSLEGVTPESHPRTARLLGSGRRKAAQKLIEEAGEVALEAMRHDAAGVVRESADLLYHLVVLWHRLGIPPADIWTEMRRRADRLGIAEKLPKAAVRKPQFADPSGES
jgi:phosphoribosyl-ATP pyrophosphohydrolase